MRNPKSNSKKDLQRGVDFTGVSCVFYCHDGQGKLLLHKRSQNCRDEIGNWDVGAGALEFGEDLEDAVKREIKEEYGCEELNLRLVGPYSLVRQNNNKPTHWVLIAFAAHIDPSQVRINEPEKMDEIGWFELDNLPTPLHSGVKYYLPNVKQYIIPS